jgi:hypothetical protein
MDASLLDAGPNPMVNLIEAFQHAPGDDYLLLIGIA